MTATETLDWSEAERVAAQSRQLRLHPTPRQMRSDQVLGPVVIVVWAVTVVLAVVGRIVGADLGDGLGLASSGGAFVVLGLGLWWLSSTGRFLLRGSERSIRSALPTGAWPSVKRQLACRIPVDRDHADVVVELAQQQRRLLVGQAVFIAWYVPLFVNLLSDLRNWLVTALLALAACAYVVVLVLEVVTSRRLGRLIAQHPGSEIAGARTGV